MSTNSSTDRIFQVSREVLDLEFPGAYLDELRLLLDTGQLEKFLAGFSGQRIQVPALAKVRQFMTEFEAYSYLVSSRTVLEFAQREKQVSERYSLSRKQIQDLLTAGPGMAPEGEGLSGEQV